MPGIYMNSMSRRRTKSSVAKKMVASYPRLPRDVALCESRLSGQSARTTESTLLPALPPAGKGLTPKNSWGQFIDFDAA
eukprot:scaffold6634_cov158-Amphora_coffeaeformis.AAC.7